MEISQTSAVSSILSVGGKGAAAGTGTATGVEGFGQMLVQVMGIPTEGSNGQGDSLSLSQLLSGLLSGLPEDEAKSLLEELSHSGMEASVEELIQQPEGLDMLLGNEEVQAWMAQAMLLLQDMPNITNKVQLAVVDAQADQSEPVYSFTRQEALDILKAVSNSTKDGNVLMEQLKGNWLSLVSKLQNPTLTASGLTEPSLQNATGGQNTAEGKLQLEIVTGAKQPNRLEMLAAKTTPLNRLELLYGTASLQAGGEEAPVQQADGTNSGSLVSGLQQDSSRLMPLRTPIPTEGVVRADRLVEDLSQFMTGRLRFSTENGITQARITLMPETLGQLEVKLTLQNGQLVAQFSAQSAMAKDMLEAQLPQLRMALASQGIQVEKMEVTQSSTLQSSLFQDQRQQQSQQFNGQSRRQSGEGSGDELDSEAATVRKALNELEADGFDVTA